MVYFSHKNFPIGYLHFQNDKWVFEYSEKFKEQKNISPIIDFPEVNKVYESEDLWPYFASRIPSSNSPHIKRKIQMNDLDESSIVEMLKVFGRNSISSPFSLRFMI